MCGFIGQIDSQLESNLRKRAEKTAHRGPDETTHTQFGKLEIFFFRLSIIGVENGRQPFVSDSEGVLTAVNGEVYNYRQLREELEYEGIRFASQSDSEVVHWGFIKWGLKVFERLEGMFAAAIYEREANRITLARDRLGKKPLYWKKLNGNLYFSSELSALVDPQSPLSGQLIAEYLSTDSISWHPSSDSAVNCVPAATWIQVDDLGENSEQFWDLEQAVLAQRRFHRSRASWLSGFEKVLHDSVEARTMSDVPIGVFLSGGRDSKLIAAAASRYRKIERAYTLKFDSPSFDEVSGAASFARELGLDHELVDASIESIAEAWGDYRNQIDEPVADAGILGELLLARHARESTKVVLTGDGGDELMLGYQHVVAHSLANSPVALLAAKTAAKLAVPFVRAQEDKYFSLGFVLDRFLRGAGESDLLMRDLLWRASFSPEESFELLAKPYSFRPPDLYNALALQVPDPGLFNDWRDRWSFLYLRTYLREVILKKVDRATMRFGVEARNPLLDRRVVEYSLSMPPSIRRSFFHSKKPLDYCLKRLVPTAQILSAKHGMGIPLVRLMKGPLCAEIRALADEDFLAHQEIFRPQSVSALISAFSNAPELYARKIWSLLVFQSWWKNHFKY